MAPSFVPPSETFCIRSRANGVPDEPSRKRKKVNV
jgi:hypothetical protein